jgi:CBS domain-containing protein
MDQKLLVADLMSREVHTVRRNDRLLDADRLMKNERIRHLLVLDEQDKLAGVVSQRDLFHSAVLKALGYGSHGMEKVLEMFPVKEAMRTEVVTATPNETAKTAAARMLDQRIGCLPVLDDGQIVGVLTETDFVRLAERLVG